MVTGSDSWHAGSGAAGAFAGRPTTLSDIADIRRRAREDLECGAVTPGYSADRQFVLGLLNSALATELVCMLRYRRHYFMATGLLAEAIKKEFLIHSQQEQEHADRIAERIVQLGGEPEMRPSTLEERSHAEFREGRDLADMVREDLVAERIAIETYREMIAYLQGRDHTTARLIESILAVEEEHAEELSSMLQHLSQLLPEGNGGNGASARHESGPA